MSALTDSTGELASLRGFGGATTGKIGMWVFLATDAMGFGALLLAYAVLRTRSGSWPNPGARYDRALAVEITFVLLMSGATMTAAVAALRQDRRRLARELVALTVLGGLAFLAGQAAEYHALVTFKHVGFTVDHAAATFYLITAYHGLHVVVGVIVLTVIASKPKFWRETPHERPLVGSAPRQVDAGNILEVASLYWQFVDVVWIVLFTAFYLWPPVIHG